MDDVLKYLGFDLKFDDLTPKERETFYEKLENLKQQKPPTISDEQKYIRQMRDSVEQELTKPNISQKEDLYLKARLRNLLLLDAFLTDAVKAEEALRKAEAITRY